MSVEAFYRALASAYDCLFPEDAATTAFLAAGLPAGARVLDLACGTGTCAAALARLGFLVTGIDLSADLVALGLRRGGPARLLTGDMRRFRALAPGPFDRIVCIGNSLPHLGGEGEVARLLADARGALAPGGSLIVQTVNFDRGPALTRLPPLRAGDLVFERRYLWRGDKVTFAATLSRPGAAALTASVDLLPLTSGRLAALAREAGFGSVRLSGGFDAVPHSRDSFLTVLSAGI